MSDEMRVARVLHEDDKWITLEVAKSLDTPFNLTMDEDGNTVGGDQFLTMVFLHNDGTGRAVPWLPWEG